MAPLRFVVVALSALLLMAFTLDRPFEGKSLKVLAFPGALTSGVIRDFEASTGATLEVHPYEGALEVLRDEGGIRSQGFDVLLGAESLILPMAFRGHLRVLNDGALPNGVHLEKGVLSGPVHDYARPYLMGVTGLAYRRDKLPFPPTSWSQCLDPESPWAGKVLLLNDRRQALGVALKALGTSVNEERPYIVTQAGRWLEERLDVLGGLDSLTPLDRLSSGEMWIAQAYDTEARALEDRRIAFFVPEEGGLLFADVAALGAEGVEVELGEAFINYLLHPVVAKRLAFNLKRAAPNRGTSGMRGTALHTSGFRQRRPLNEGLRPVGGAALAFDVAWGRIQREMEALQ